MKEEAPLDMRMDKSSKLTAREVVNFYTESDLARILDEYGEERFAKRIAKNICEARKIRSIETCRRISKNYKKVNSR